MNWFIKKYNEYIDDRLKEMDEDEIINNVSTHMTTLRVKPTLLSTNFEE